MEKDEIVEIFEQIDDSHLVDVGDPIRTELRSFLENLDPELTVRQVLEAITT